MKTLLARGCCFAFLGAALPARAADGTAPPSAQSGGCTQTFSAAALKATLDRMEESYRKALLEEFEAIGETADEQLRCLSQPLTPTLAAQVHGVWAMRQFTDKEDAAMLASLTAARWASQGRYELPDFLIPSHPLRDALAQADTAGGRFATLPEPAEGTLYLDGDDTLQRPEGWPVIVQHVDGEVQFTRVLAPGEAPPRYPTAGDARSPVRFVLWAGAALAAAGSAASFVAADAAKDDYMALRADVASGSPSGSPSGLRADADDLRAQTNSRFGLGVGLGGAAVGLLIPAVVIEW